MRGRVAVGFAIAIAACSGRDATPPARYDGGPPPRRVIGAPPRPVRALPPHAIGAEGVGPYKLGVPMAQILSSLPSGPRMAVLQIPGVLDYNIVRDEGLVIGGERQGVASFIGIVRAAIARTAEDGVAVGAAVKALTEALGPPASDPAIARSPALWVGAKLPNARFVIIDGRVAGVLLTVQAAAASGIAAPVAPAAPAPDADAGVPAARCERSAAEGFEGLPSGVQFVPACLGGADAVGVSDDMIVVAARAARGAPARRIATLEIRGLVWAAPVEVDRGRDEIVAVAENRGDEGRTFSVIALRLEGTRLVRVAEDVAYRLDETRAAWIGAALSDLALHLEVADDGDAFAVGGVLVHNSFGGVRELAPLLPVTIRRRGRIAEVDKGRLEGGSDAGVTAGGGAGPGSGQDGGIPDAPAAPSAPAP